MNKVYKIIWSKVKGCYVVVSELAKSHSKNKSSSYNGGIISGLILTAVMAGIYSLPMNIAHAGDADGVVVKNYYGTIGVYPEHEGISYDYYYDNNGNKQVRYYNSVNLSPVGGGDWWKANHVRYPEKPAEELVDIGYKSAYTHDGLGTWNLEEFRKLYNDKSDDNGQGVSLGPSTHSSAQASAVGNDAYALGRSSIAIGSDDIKSYRDVISEYDNEHYFGPLYRSIDKEGHKYGFGTDDKGVPIWSGGATYADLLRKFSPTLAQGDGSIAIGARSLAYNSGATAVGTLAFALKKGATAIGTQSRSEGEGSIAIGNNTKVFAANSVGAGNELQIVAKGGMAYGYRGYAGGENSIAIGSKVYANTKMNLDTKYTKDSKTYSVFNKDGADKESLYYDLESAAKLAGKNGENLSAAGKTYLDSLEEVVTKDEIYSPVFADAEKASGFTDVVSSAGKNALVIGSYSMAVGDNGIAVGHGSYALGKNNFAIGSFSFAKNPNAMAIGLASRALGENSIAIGVGTSTDENASKSLALGTGSVNHSASSSLIGTNSLIDKDSDSSILFGVDSSLKGSSNISIGNTNHVYSFEDATHPLKSTKNVALGNSIQVSSGVSSSVAIGVEAKIGEEKIDENSGKSLGPAGDNPTAIAQAIALGYRAKVHSGVGDNQTGVSAMAIGTNAEATLNNSVALGTDSNTDYTAEDLQALPWVMNDAIGVPTTAQTGVVSVGRKDAERRIVNVASGFRPTDAVNVAQLKMVAEQLSADIGTVGGGRAGGSYQSIERNKGLSGRLLSDINTQEAYKQYVDLKSSYLSYLTREKYNGEIFNPRALETIKNRIDEMEHANSDFVSKAAKLNAITVENPEVKELNHDTYDAKMKAIKDAFEVDRKVQVTNLTEAEINEKKQKANYDNRGASGADSLAFGYGAHTGNDAANSIALGVNSQADGAGGIAIGANAHVVADNSVALGKDSVATLNGAQAAEGVSFGTGYSNFNGAMKTPNAGIVSVGRDKDNEHEQLTRRITNVAAGAADTDAVNVAQIKTLTGDITGKFAAINEDNLYLSYTANGDTNKKKVPLSTGLNFTNGTNTTATVDTNGKVNYSLNSTLENVEAIKNKGTTLKLDTNKVELQGSGTDGVTITGVKEGASDNDAVNFKQIKALKSVTDQLINQLNSTSNTTNEGDINNKVYQIYNGTAGNMVYTTADGSLVLKFGGKFYSNSAVVGKAYHDGKWYNAADMENGQPKAGAQEQQVDAIPDTTPIVISAVASDGATTTPIVIANVKSALDVDSKTENNGIQSGDAKTIVNGLLDKHGSELQKAATLGDVQAVAQAGLDFTTNQEDTNNAKVVLHRALGSAISIVGNAKDALKEKFNVDDFSGDNIYTSIDPNKGVKISMAKSPIFKSIKLGDTTTNNNGGSTTNNGGSTTNNSTMEITVEGDNIVIKKEGDTNIKKIITAPADSSGIKFSTNVANTKVEKHLGEELVLKGDAPTFYGTKFKATDFVADNIYTSIDPNDNSIKINMAKSPTFKSIKLGDTTITNNNPMEITVEGDNIVIKKEGDTNIKKIITAPENNFGIKFSTNLANTKVEKHLGDELVLKGDAPTFYGTKFNAADFVASNIYTSVDRDSIKINMAKSPVFKSIKFGDIVNGDIINKGPELTFEGDNLVIKGGDTNNTYVKNVVTTASTEQAGFYVRSGKGNKIFVPMNGILDIEGTNPVVVKSEALPTTGSNNPSIPANNNTNPVNNVPASNNNAVATPSPTVNNTNGGNNNSPEVGSKVNIGIDTNTKFTSIKVNDITNNETDGSKVVNKNYVDNKVNDITNNITNNLTKNITDNVTKNVTDKVTNNVNNIVKDTVHNTMTKEVEKIVDTKVEKTFKTTTESIQKLDQRMDQRMEEVSSRASAGTAAAMAAGSIPPVLDGERRNVLGVGMGAYHGERAMALGFFGANKDRDVVYKLATTVDSTGAYGFTAGVGFTLGPKDEKVSSKINVEDFNRLMNKVEEQSKEIADLKAEIQALKESK